MTEREKERVAARLSERAEELARTRRAIRREGEGMVDSELSHVDNHPADDGTETHDQQIDVTTEVFLDEEERRIEEARRALEDGTYGTCVSCGNEIPTARLEAMPEAVRCIDCQRGFEAEHRRANDAVT